MNSRILMKCGHSTNLYNDFGLPYCLVCNCNDKADNEPDLSERKMKCSDCGTIENSNKDRFLFKYRPESEYDSFYCGCRGWD